MKKILSIVLILSCFLSFGQKDTIVEYLDQTKTNFVAKDKAQYTRLIIRKNPNVQVLFYDLNGQLVSDELFSDIKLSKEIGIHNFFHKNGQLRLIKTYNDKSQYHGNFSSFFIDGGKSVTGIYRDNKREGVWNFHYPNGNRIARLVYSKGEVKKYNLWYENGEVKNEKLIFEKRPSFKGGKKSLSNYVRRKLTPKFRKSKFKGRLILRFAINKEGRPVDIKIHPESLTEKEINNILRFFKEMPNWEPGIQLNRKVKVRYTLPIKLN
tara:strand:- start:78138 stop:78935 length:798 start_codon:yes stop_codon:yes gene_type:complete